MSSKPDNKKLRNIILVLIVSSVTLLLGRLIFQTTSNKTNKIAKVNSPWTCEDQFKKIADLKSLDSPNVFINNNSEKELLLIWKKALIQENGWNEQEFEENIRLREGDVHELGEGNLFIGFFFIKDWIDIYGNNYVDITTKEPIVIWQFPKTEIVSCDTALNLVNTSKLNETTSSINFSHTEDTYLLYSHHSSTKPPCKSGSIDLESGEIKSTHTQCPVN